MKALIHQKTITSKTGICIRNGGWVYHYIEGVSVYPNFLVFKRYML